MIYFIEIMQKTTQSLSFVGAEIKPFFIQLFN